MLPSGYAVDLGGTKIAAARIAAGKVTARLQVATDRRAGVAAQVDEMAVLLAKLGHRKGDPLGVAVTGRVDRGGNWHAVNTGTLQAITSAPLGQMLIDRFGPLTRALNDAASAALAEAHLGAGQGAVNFAYLTVSTGIGGGLVFGGRLLESDTGLAGHVGFTTSRLSDTLCGSGRTGTVESVAGGRAIAAAAGLPDARAVFASPAHDAVIARAAAAVAGLVADLTAILGLDRVAVGGSIGLADGFLSRVTAHLANEPALFQTPVVTAALCHDSGLIGALLAATRGRG